MKESSTQDGFKQMQYFKCETEKQYQRSLNTHGKRSHEHKVVCVPHLGSISLCGRA